MTDRASRIAEITEREAGLAHTVVPARYLMSAPPFTPTPGPEAELAQLRARVDALQAELSASEGRVKEARKVALTEERDRLRTAVETARDQFAFYADEHERRAKACNGPNVATNGSAALWEKHHTNRKLAEKMAKALTAGRDGT